MTTDKRRIAIVVGAGFVPGMNAVIKGAVQAANQLGWEVVGIRDGFDGLLYPDRYPEGGLKPLTVGVAERLDPAASSVLGQASRVDPFYVRRIDEDDMIEEVDMSDELLQRLREEQIDGLISVVGNQGLNIFYKLNAKGLKSVCIPLEVENDIATTLVSFGFNTALGFTIEMLDKARQAAIAARKIAVVEVLGEDTGWIALQAGMAACADAILIPEIPGDLREVAANLRQKMSSRRPYGLVVVAQGAKVINKSNVVGKKTAEDSLRGSLSPLATGGNSEYVIQRSGEAGMKVANSLQLLIAEDVFPMVLGPWTRGGAPTAVDRQLGMVYGANAIRALSVDKAGTMVAYVPPDVKFVPLEETINRIRAVSMDNQFIHAAESMGICLGRKVP